MKGNLTLSIDVEVLSELKTRKVNISNLINNFLKEYLNIKEEINNEVSLDTQISILKAKIKEKEEIKAKRLKEYSKRFVRID